MPEMEAVGEAISGAAVASAIEPGHGAEDGHTHESACLNCRAALVGDYCHQCGQKAHVHRTIAAWWHDLAHGVLHLDGKVWRTLPMLAWRPGELTRRYIEGERASFVSPLAIFLFSVFLMFAVFSAAGARLVDADDLAVSVQEEVARAEKDIAALERRRAAAAAAGQATTHVDLQLADRRDDLSALRQVDDPIGQISASEPPMLRFFDSAFRKAKENPSLLFYKLQNNAYKFSWALIPLSVPFLWLLFLHRRRYRTEFGGYDHFVFVTYSIATMSLLLIAFVVVRAAGLKSDMLNFALVLIPPLHIYRQLRGAYRLGRWSAAWRAAVLLAMAVTVLVLFGLILLAVGVLG